MRLHECGGRHHRVNPRAVLGSERKEVVVFLVCVEIEIVAVAKGEGMAVEPAVANNIDPFGGNVVSLPIAAIIDCPQFAVVRASCPPRCGSPLRMDGVRIHHR